MIFNALISISSDRASRFRVLHPFIPEISTFGVNGHLIPAKKYFELAVRGRQRVLSPGELGCAMSHIAALEHFLNGEDQYAIIYEDDATVKNIQLYSEIIKNIEGIHGPVLVHLGGQEGLVGMRRLYGARLGGGLWELHPFALRWLWRTCGYVVNRSMAKMIIDKQKKCTTMADSWSHFCKGADVSVYFKNIVTHPEELSESSIENDRVTLESVGYVVKFIRRVSNFMVLSFLVLSRYRKIY